MTSTPPCHLAPQYQTPGTPFIRHVHLHHHFQSLKSYTGHTLYSHIVFTIQLSTSPYLPSPLPSSQPSLGREHLTHPTPQPPRHLIHPQRSLDLIQSVTISLSPSLKFIFSRPTFPLTIFCKENDFAIPLSIKLLVPTEVGRKILSPTLHISAFHSSRLTGSI